MRPTSVFQLSVLHKKLEENIIMYSKHDHEASPIEKRSLELVIDSEVI